MDGSQQNECPVQGDTPELFFCEDLKGYGWCIRKGNFLNIGLGREDSDHFTGRMKTFFDYLKEKGKVPRTTPENFKGHAYLLYNGVSDSLVDDGVMLIGDAAGLASPKSGEGIRPAVESAFMAAEVIFFAGRDYRRDRLLSYPLQLAGRFGRGRATSGLFLHSLRRFAGRKLMESTWFSRHVLLDRWFLNRRQPALAEATQAPPSGSSTSPGRPTPARCA